MMPVNLLIACLTIIVVVAVIAISVYRYSSSDAVRALLNANEKYNNLDTLTRQKDTVYNKTLEHKEEECKRMTDIIKSLMEKQGRYSVDASIQGLK
jgi:hypothetical protein